MRSLFFMLFFLCYSLPILAMDSYWNPETPPDASTAIYYPHKAYWLDLKRFKSVLADKAGRPEMVRSVELPVPEGGLARYSVLESRVMDEVLAQKYPAIRTYRLIDETGHVRGTLDTTRNGMHAMLYHRGKRILIDPDGSDTSAGRYLLRTTPDHRHREFSCNTESKNHHFPGYLPEFDAPGQLAARTPEGLKEYRLVVAATQEYTAAVGGSVEAALSEIVTAINRVNQIYERDLGVRLVLVGNNDDVIFLSGDPFTNANANLLIDEVQVVVDNFIGSSNYDIGHVFSTGGGGLAQVGAVCVDGLKAQGVTGTINPVGDPFYIDFVAHEIGHQFGANHSFNGTSGSCAIPNRNALTAYEPGSGSTIMAYAGICGGENLQNNSDSNFHAGSIEEIDSYLSTVPIGVCGQLVQITNNTSPPSANAGSDIVIPANTPFRLTGTGTDADGEDLSFQWDQMDAGSATNSVTFGTDLVDNALMRSFLPNASGERIFPRLSSLLTGVDDRAETLPTTSRVMNFRLTVRDGLSGLTTDDVSVQVDNASGPFTVTGPVLSPIQAVVTVTWDVANTNVPPVNCQQVDINLLTFDGGRQNFCRHQLLSLTANDGSEAVTLGGSSAGDARFELICSNGGFFNISPSSLSISGSGAYPTNCQSVDGVVQAHGSSNIEPLSSTVVPAQFASAVAINVPTNISGFIPGGLLAQYQFDALNSDYTFNLGWTDSADLDMVLYDAQGTEVIRADSDNINSEVFSQGLTDATYYLEIIGDTPDQAFNVRISLGQSSEPSELPGNESPQSSSSGGGVFSLHWILIGFMLQLFVLRSRESPGKLLR